MYIEEKDRKSDPSGRHADSASERFRRLLYYSPNTTGIGHESRAIALLTGLRRYLEKTEFLVVSSTSVPQQFLRHNLEIVRLPTLSGKPTINRLELAPRYLVNTDLSDVRTLRQSLLNTVFDNYRPDLVMVDHHPIGLDGEILPWLIRKRFSPKEFVTTYISRGVIAQSVYIQPPYLRTQRGVDVINIADLYDRFYILEQQDRLDPEVRATYTTADFADRVRFLDRVTVKTHAELFSASQVAQIYQLPTGHLITANLGHNAVASGLLEQIIKGFTLINSDEVMTLLVVMSPYLDSYKVLQVQSQLTSERVIIRPFIPDLVDILNVSVAAICRAGYNTIAELELTGCPALIIPEDYGSHEQLLRADSLKGSGYSVLMPDSVTPERVAETLRELLQEPRRAPCLIDKYSVSYLLLADLLALQSKRK